MLWSIATTWRCLSGRCLTSRCNIASTGYKKGMNSDDKKTVLYTGSDALPPALHSCPLCGLEVPLSVSKCPNDGTKLTDTLGEGRKLVGNYEFLEFIGSGGMGVIYKARHPVLKRLVAIKMLHSHLMTDTVIKRFQQEALAVSGLSHPNIIAVHDFGLSDHGQPYMVMDFVDGKPLSEVLKQGPLNLEAVINISIQIAEGLQHAHEHGILHRDLKPSNIMVTDYDCSFPEVRIVDFGIAKILETEATRVTQTGELLGTPQYMSPEQCRGTELDARSDIYALGCAMFESITGRTPFSNESMVAVIIDQISTPARSLGEVRPDIVFPIELEDLISKTLAKEPVDRFQSMNALLEELVEVQKVVAITSKRKFSLQRFLRLNRDQRHVLLLSLAAVFTLIGVASSSLLFVKNVRDARDKAAAANIAKAPPTSGSVYLPRLIEDRKNIVEHLDSSTIDGAFVRSFFSDDLQIQQLNLTRAKIGDNDLVPLTSQKSLRKLRLQGTKITNNGLITLKFFDNLNSLNIDQTEVTDDGLKHLPALRKLQILSTSMMNVGDKGLAHLEPMNLQELSFQKTPVTDKGLKALENMRTLSVVNLRESGNVKSAGIKYLQNLPLRELDLELTGIDDAALTDIAKIRSLQILHIGGTKITTSGIRKLQGMPLLNHLRINATDFSADWIATLKSMPQLRKMSLAWTHLNDSNIAEFVEKLPELENLDLEGTKLSDAGIQQLKKLKHLSWVNLKQTLATRAGVDKLNKTMPKGFWAEF